MALIQMNRPFLKANLRALKILAARVVEEECRKSIGSIEDKRERGSLRKGAYYLARIIYLKHSSKIDPSLAKAATRTEKAAYRAKSLTRFPPSPRHRSTLRARFLRRH